MITSLVLASLLAGPSQKFESKLIDIKPVTQFSAFGELKISDPFSMSGVVFGNGIILVRRTPESPQATLVYSIPEGTASFRAFYGAPEGELSDSDGASSLTLFLDGEKMQVLTLDPNKKPSKIDIKLNGARSLKLQFSGTGALGEPMFSAMGVPAKTDTQVPTTPVKPGELPRLVIDEPENGSTAKDKLVIKWQPIEGATSYGVEIVMISNNDPKKIATRPLRAFTSKGTTFEWNFNEEVISGEYQVSIIAFGKKGVLSKFSAPRRVKISRK